MVEVRIARDSRERLSSFFAGGHAGWDEYGKDVVCAAVATLLQSAWLGLDEIAQVKVEASKGDGRLSLRWPEAARSDATVRGIVETAARSIEHLARQYPDQVKVVTEKADDG